MKALLGLDEGTSAVKAILFDLQLRPIASARREKRILHRGDGLVEQDPDELLEAVVDSVAELLEQASGIDIVACGLVHQGESVLAFDRVSGRPLSPVITWQDKRSQPLLSSFDAATSAKITALSGLPLDPYFSAGKVAWLLEQGLPDDVCIGTVDSFLCACLGAGFATDLSTASRTQLARLGEGHFDQHLCDIFGVSPGNLPTLRDSIGALGTLSHPRWRVDLPLGAQLVDQQGALAGSGCVLPGTAKATFGTGVFVLSNVGAAAPRDAAELGLLPTVAWSHSGTPTYALDGGVFSAGSLLDWFAGGLGLYESSQELAELGASVPDTQGVTVLPALTGLGAPWWKPDARAVISGLSGSVGRAHVARAAIEGICQRVCDVLDAMRDLAAINELRIDGGLTRSALVPQLLADLEQVPVRLGAQDTTALGAAALAGVGMGVFDSLEEIASLIEPAQEVIPSAGARSNSLDRASWRRFVERAAAL